MPSNWTSRASLVPLTSLLHELERHAVALADRRVFLAVHVPLAERRRQRPHALGIVFRVLRVGVGFALAGEPETLRLDLLDQPLLREVALLRALHRVGARSCAVLLDAEDATALQGSVDRTEPGIQRARVDHAV